MQCEHRLGSAFDRVHVVLTHGEIGECIGTCRESVTRILGDLQRRQIVNLRGSILTVMDRPALEICAGI
jgi:CRP/FNR family transcriptional regulator